MNINIPELWFATRSDFRKWLYENAESSRGVWLVFGKGKNSITLTASEALEEALCFGWIDGQIKSIDATRYIKYFARRRPKSIWSEKNRKAIPMLRERKLMTALGEQTIQIAMKNGTWEAQKSERGAITDEQIDAFVAKLSGISSAQENFMQMSPSIRRTYTGRYLSFKSEEAHERDFVRIVDRLNKNLKPM